MLRALGRDSRLPALGSLRAFLLRRMQLQSGLGPLGFRVSSLGSRVREGLGFRVTLSRESFSQPNTQASTYRSAKPESGL